MKFNSRLMLLNLEYIGEHLNKIHVGNILILI